MTKYSRKCRRIGSMAKTSNVAQRRIKKRTTRKKRGGGNVFSTSKPIEPIEPSDVNTPLRAVTSIEPPQNEVNASLRSDYEIARDNFYNTRENFWIAQDKIFRYTASKIYNDEKLTWRVQGSANELVYAYKNITRDYFEEGDIPEGRYLYMQRFLDVYNKFCKNNPEICRIYDYPDDIMNLEFADDKFQDRDEVINYLLEKDPNIFKKFRENAFNEALAKFKLTSQDKLTSQGIPESQELGGGRRKKTTRKKRG